MDHAKNETGYKIERKIKNGNFIHLTTTNANISAFQDYALPGGTSASYRVYATNTGGDSKSSNEVIATTLKSNVTGANWTVRRALGLYHALETVAYAPIWQPDGTVRIKDVSNIPVPSGYAKRYFVNEVMIDGELEKAGPFQPSTDLSIVKVVSRGSDLWNWQNGKNDYIKPELCGMAEVFTGYAPGSAPLRQTSSGARRFRINPVHSTDWLPIKERSGNLTKFAKTGKKLGVTLRTDGLKWDDLQSRGFQFVGGNGVGFPRENQMATPGTHQSGPHAAKLGRPVTHWTKAECREFGRNQFGVVGLTADQLNEGYGPMEEAGIIHTNTSTYQWVYEGALDAARKFKPHALLIGSYETKYGPDFKPGGGKWNPDTHAHRAALTLPEKARAGLWWFDLDVSHYVMPIYQFYPSDYSRDRLYEQAYAIQRLQKGLEEWGRDGMDMGAWTYLWPMIASNGFHDTIFNYELELPTGKVYQQALAANSFNSIAAMCLNTFILTGKNGGVYVWEDGLRFSETDPHRISAEFGTPDKPKSLWKPIQRDAPPIAAQKPVMPGRPTAHLS